METRQRLLSIAAENLSRFLQGCPQNVVNHPQMTKDTENTEE